MIIKNISFCEKIESGSTVVGVYDDASLSAAAQELDTALGGALSKSIQKIANPQTPWKLFVCKSFVSLDDQYNHIICVGLGAKGKKFSNFELEKLGASIYACAKCVDVSISVSIDSSDISSETASASEIPQLIAFGLMLKSWTFDVYKTKKDEKDRLASVSMVSASSFAEASGSFQELKNLADAVFLTRHVVSEPSNVVFPESFAEIAQKELLPLGVGVEVLDQENMKTLGMNSLLAVAQGSENEPKLVVLSWNGAGNNQEKPIAFVGKGVTFDSGGISLKPGDGMSDMRHDMAGSAVVFGLMKAVALNKLPVNIVCIMGLVENMPSGSAQRPGDIVYSMSGQTIEVLNTDAEGRMVLADAMWYVQEEFSPSHLIDIATLTGAVVVALGHEFAGLFSNSDELVEQIESSAASTGEKVWRMPLTDNFDKGINSDFADMQNIAKSHVRGGSITAAQFLKRFVKEGTQWAHIDIAGVETSIDDLFICDNGTTTGFGVHLLYDFLKKNYVS